MMSEKIIGQKAEIVIEWTDKSGDARREFIAIEHPYEMEIVGKSLILKLRDKSGVCTRAYGFNDWDSFRVTNYPEKDDA